MIKDKLTYRTHWTIRRFADDAAFRAGVPTAVIDANGVELPAVTEIDGNLLLNEGIQLLLDLLIGAGGTAYNNANSYIGVGDTNTAESASQTGLQAPTNKLYKAMESSYPSRASQTVTWRAVFGSAEANYAWNEFTVANGSSDAATNLNRKTSVQGTKASGQVWTVDVSITIT